MRICYSFASRSRKDRFFEAINNIKEMSTVPDYFIVVKIDTDDPAMNNSEVLNMLWLDPYIIVKLGTSRSKIHAINRDLEDIPRWDVMVCMSDDMRFRTKGYDQLIRQYMPEDLDGFVHLQDDYAKDRVCTVSILGRKYYERDNAIYYDGYYSMWCDDEATDVAKIRGKHILVPGVHIEHLHYTNKSKAQKDALYWRNDTYNKDKEIYLTRKKMNFGL